MTAPNMTPFTALPMYGDFVESYTTVQRLELVRMYRNACLLSTDWTQVADSPVDKQAWAVYRQQLRDIMAGYDGTTTEIVWPTPPSAIVNSNPEEE